MTLDHVINFLKNYPNPAKIMEVCGTHTSVIAKSGIREILSPNIRLVSGPGCPVCVTSASYIDALIDLAMDKKNCLLSFGDLIRVPGTKTSLSEAMSRGADVKIIYSPLEALKIAKKDTSTRFVVAAVGFETTTPVYAALIEELTRQNIKNVQLYTSLKTMPAALDFLCGSEMVDGFLCPGHVSSVIGSNAFEPLALRYKKPFVVSGFTPEHVIIALYHILKQLVNSAHMDYSYIKKSGYVKNLYKSAVKPHGNEKAQALTHKYFIPIDGFWRGIGWIEQSALKPRPEFAEIAESGIENWSKNVDLRDNAFDNSGCLCGEVMLGRINPNECPLFGSSCRPEHPIGACMVSSEGACGIWYTK